MEIRNSGAGGYDIIVQAGDTLSEISAETGLSVAYLRERNEEFLRDHPRKDVLNEQRGVDTIFANTNGKYGTVLHVGGHKYKAPVAFVESADKDIMLPDGSLHHRTLADVAKLDVNHAHVKPRQIAALNADRLLAVAEKNHVVINKKKDVLAQLAALELPAGTELLIPQRRWHPTVPTTPTAPKVEQTERKPPVLIVRAEGESEDAAVPARPEGADPKVPEVADVTRPGNSTEPTVGAAGSPAIEPSKLRDNEFRAGAIHVYKLINKKLNSQQNTNEPALRQKAIFMANNPVSKEAIDGIIKIAVDAGVDEVDAWNAFNQGIRAAEEKRKSGEAKQ